MDDPEATAPSTGPGVAARALQPVEEAHDAAAPVAACASPLPMLAMVWFRRGHGARGADIWCQRTKRGSVLEKRRCQN
jgi:hypothetical protein